MHDAAQKKLNKNSQKSPWIRKHYLFKLIITTFYVSSVKFLILFVFRTCALQYKVTQQFKVLLFDSRNKIVIVPGQ